MPVKKDPNKLTAKQKLFCQEYLANGMKLQKAYMAAFPTCTPGTANVRSSELIRRDSIKAYIRELQHERFEQLGINADSIATQLKEIAMSEDSTNAEKMKALDLLQKQMGLQTQKVEADIKTTVIEVDVDGE